MHVLFYIADPRWQGSTRVFAAAATGLAARGYDVTIVCPPESAAEQQLTRLDVEVVPLEAEGGWLAVGRRLRRVLRERMVETVFVHTEREQLVAAAAMRMGDRGVVVRRVPAGGRLAFGGFTTTPPIKQIPNRREGACRRAAPPATNATA